MTLGPGPRLGPYEVTGLIGEGGIGKVCRAHHTALRRDDALKVLPDFASDPDRIARFRREAQVLASLNHPNIAHVYGLEQSDGVQALVMELVEGPTTTAGAAFAVSECLGAQHRGHPRRFILQTVAIAAILGHSPQKCSRCTSASRIPVAARADGLKGDSTGLGSNMNRREARYTNRMWTTRLKSGRSHRTRGRLCG